MKQVYLLLLFCLMSVVGWGQVTIAAYSGEATSSAVAVSNASAVALSSGSGVSPTGSTTFNNIGWSTSSSVTNAISSDDYIEWSITANSGFTVTVETIEIDYDRSGTGPSSVSIRTSLDSYSSDIFTDNSVNSSGEENLIDVSGFSLTSTSGGTITFRLYGYNASSGSGTFDVEDDLGTVLSLPNIGIILSGSVDAASSNSSDSDIIEAGFDEPDNIDYSSYSASSGLTTVNAIKIGEFTIRDGGAGGSDSDSETTILTAISFSIQNSGNLAALALFDGSSNVGEATTVTSTTSFSGLTLAASDGGTKSFSVYATFNSTVMDNDQVQLTISSATADGSGSIFSTGNAGGAATNITGDDNRIEVTATDLIFDQEPSDVNVNAAMSPSPTILAIDGNVNTDADFTATVSLTTTGSFSGTATTSVGAVSGVATFSNLIFSTTGTSLTIEGGAAGVNNTGASSTFDVTELANLVISEIMYNPSDPDNTHEFLEIFNAGASTVDLDGFTLSNAVSFTFQSGDQIASGEYIIAAVLAGTYSGNGYQVFQFSGALNNTGETIILRDASSNLIDAVAYDDGDISSTDGTGPSYEIISTAADNSSTASNWQASANNGGTPGAASSVLPVSLIYFTAQKINSTTHLHWRTSTEINNNYMAVERSSDGQTFVEIGRVEGAGTTQVEQSYSFVDKWPLQGVNYYRLRQVDFDGRYEYHETVAVDFSSEATDKLVVYPTQAKDHLQIVAGTEMNEETQVQVLSADGRIWKTISWLEKSTQMELSVEELPTGSYWLRVLAGKRVEQAYFQKI